MRYVTIRPRMDWREDGPMLEGKTIHEPEPIKTGLLDHDGHPIYRVTSPIGFIELKERPTILEPKTPPDHFTKAEIAKTIRKVTGKK